jgi:hypothetical protein
MQVEIRYETSSDMEYCCCARAKVRGQSHFGIGKNWEQAKESLLRKLNNTLSQTVPAPEQVEIKVADEEMETEFFPFENMPARAIEETKKV